MATPGRALESPRIAIVLPVHNEADSIERTLREIAEWAEGRRAEMFVFEDGSTDGTKEILADLARSMPSLYVVLADHRKGYPRAVRDALLAIPADRFDLVLFADSDGQYDFRDADLLVRAMAEGDSDMIAGRRMQRREPIYRRGPSQILRVLERIFFGVQDGDVTSAFRLMRIECARRIAQEVRHSRYNFWLEFTARARRHRVRGREVDVRYRQRAGITKVYPIERMPFVVGSEFLALLRTRRDFSRAERAGSAG